jgi:hypothetical protein
VSDTPPEKPKAPDIQIIKEGPDPLSLSLLVFVAIVVFFLIVASASGQQIADLAPEYRQRNRSGSCGHASTTSALRWLQEHNKASDWWGTYRNGENFDRHLSRLRAQGIKYVATSDGDERVLEYAAWSRRGAVVYWPPRHIVNYMGRVGDRIFILDNNHTNRFDTYDYADWVQRWRRNGGCAFVILDGEVPPPVPLGRRV